MTRVRSYSMSDSDPLNRVADAGAQRHGGHSTFIRHLLGLYADALSKHGGEPSREAFGTAYLAATIEEKRRTASAATLEASVLEEALEAAREEDALREAAGIGKYRSPEELVVAVFDSAPWDSPGEVRREFWDRLAQQHGMNSRDVRRAAGKEFASRQAGQAKLRALPAPRPVTSGGGT